MIKLVLVDKKLVDYLKLLGFRKIEDLTLEQGNCLFVKIINDFKSGKLSLDELSVLGSKIFHGIAKTKGEGSDLFFTSLVAADLGFEIRNAYENVPLHMKDIDEFFEKYNK
jgi:hypothetical protein